MIYIGLMSGTSMDAVDAAMVDLGGARPRLLATHNHPLPACLRAEAAALSRGSVTLAAQGTLDNRFGHLFADAVLALLGSTRIPAPEVRGIGSHGQTVYHRPDGAHPFSLQIGDPNIIVERTGITTVADFRRRDIAAGGQGAPLVPAFHRAVLQSPDHARAVVNIGGIANLTLLPPDPHAPVRGFDTGPGNTLIDAWADRHLGVPLDRDGRWAASAQPDPRLLECLSKDPYFRLSAPKSTGLEHFNLEWVEGCLQDVGDRLEPPVVQATLVELTAHTIAEGIVTTSPEPTEVWVCGGGVHNGYLMLRLRDLLAGTRVTSTEEAGIPPDWMEAMAFAWLAQQTLDHRPGNLPSATGARHPVILGGVYRR